MTSSLACCSPSRHIAKEPGIRGQKSAVRVRRQEAEVGTQSAIGNRQTAVGSWQHTERRWHFRQPGDFDSADSWHTSAASRFNSPRAKALRHLATSPGSPRAVFALRFLHRFLTSIFWHNPLAYQRLNPTDVENRAGERWQHGVLATSAVG